MGNFDIHAGAGTGPAHFSQSGELAPYGTRYWGNELYIGAEWKRPVFNLATPIAAAVYEGTRGDDINRGSHRDAFLGRLGLRFRFLGDRLAFDAMAGAGAFNNQLNFGKGTPLPDDWSLNWQATASAKWVWCINADFCIGPKLGFSHDGTLSGAPMYSARHYFMGFDIQAGAAVPIEVTEELKRLEKENAELQKLTVDSTLSRALSTGEAAKFEKQLGAEQEKVMAAAGEIKELEEKLIKQKSVEYRWLTTLPGEFLFQNRMTDIALLEQEFDSQDSEFSILPKMCRKGNPVLDVVIRGVNAWQDGIIRLNDGRRPMYRLELTIRGYANDTGTPEINRKLADGRAQAVYHYLTDSCSTMTARGERVAPLKEKKGILDITVRKASSNPTEDIQRELLTNIQERSGEDRRTRLEEPVWRMATVTYMLWVRAGSGWKEVPLEDSEIIRGTRPSGGNND